MTTETKIIRRGIIAGITGSAGFILGVIAAGLLETTAGANPWHILIMVIATGLLGIAATELMIAEHEAQEE